MATKRADPKMVKLLVSRAGGDIVIEIPATWKVTFGYVNPSASAQSYGRGEGHCLRIYEGTKLRAVFDSVLAFRDLSIPLARKHTKETGAASWERDSMGNFEEQRSGKTDVQWQLEAGEGIESPF